MRLEGSDANERLIREALQALGVPAKVVIITIEPVTQKSVPTENRCEEDIVAVLRAAGHRLTTMQILEALDRQGMPHGESTVKAHLAGMVRRGVLDKDPDANPHGYGLPEWSA
jgi:hypothetical protein